MEVIRAMEMNSLRGDEERHWDKDCREDKEHFVGKVLLQEMFPPMEPNRLRVYLVHFEPGARTNWHVHPEFQILYVIAGKGRVRSSDGSEKWSEQVLIKKWVPEKCWNGEYPDPVSLECPINDG